MGVVVNILNSRPVSMPPSELTLFESRLLLALEADALRPKKDQCTVLMLFVEIKKEDYTVAIPWLLTSFASNVTKEPRVKLKYVTAFKHTDYSDVE